MYKSPELSVGGRHGEAIAEKDDGRCSSSFSRRFGGLGGGFAVQERYIKFYVGKSKSFTSLSDASSYSSLKELSSQRMHTSTVLVGFTRNLPTLEALLLQL